jgi:hypothetical protein
LKTGITLERMLGIIAFAFAFASAVHASPATYTFGGPFSGALNGVAFTNANMSVIATGDTSLRTTDVNGVFCVPLSSVTFSIQGVGSGTITDTMAIFANNSVTAIGLQRGCFGSDWLDSSDPGFATYDLASNLGPLSVSAFAPGNQGVVNTTAGQLALTEGVGFPMISNAAANPAPGVTLSPSSLSFPGQLTNTAGAAQTTTLTASGSATLSITSITVSGDFAQTNNCAASMPIGASCTITVTFTPTAIGTRTGSISISSNAAGSPQVVSLDGTGLAPVTQLTPTGLTFAARTVATTSTPQTITLANVGTSVLNISSLNASGDFSMVSNCGTTLAAGASCNIDVSFTPIAAGPRNGVLTVMDDAAGSPHAVTLAGTGLPAPAPVADLSSATVDFSSQQVGSESAPEVLVVTNSGNAPLTFASMAITGDFSLVVPTATSPAPCPVTLAPGDSCIFTMVFRPTGSNLRQGALTLGTNAGTLVVTLVGVGLLAEPPQLTLPVTIDFGPQPFGVKSPGRALTLHNTSPYVASIVELTATGDFAISDACTTIAPGATCTPLVTFQPTGIGPRFGSILVRTLRDANSYAVLLTGTGVENRLPAMDVSAMRLGFGNVIIGGASGQTVTLRNLGLGPLQVSAILVTGDFRSNDACQGTILPGSFCTVTISVLPSIPGGRVGVMEIISNDPGGTFDVKLTGSGCFLPTPSHIRAGTPLCGP